MLNKIADRKRNVVMNFVFPGDDARIFPGYRFVRYGVTVSLVRTWR
nr:hypothetical protein [Klebsiella aerogenes]